MRQAANKSILPHALRNVLSNGAFRHLWFGQICSQLAANTLLFVLALRVYQNTGSNTAVSALFIAYGIPAVVFGMFAGTALDHLDKRRVLILCDSARAILAVGLLFLSHTLLPIYILTFIYAVINQFYVPAEAPLIPKFIPTQLLVSANSLFSFAFYSSLALGSILAGPMLRLLGPQGVFLVIGLLFLVAALNVSRVPSQALGTQGFRSILSYGFRRLLRRVGDDLVAGIHYITRSPALFDALLLLTGTQIILVLLGTLGPGFADRLLSVDARDASIFIVGPAVLGIIIGALTVGNFGSKIRPSRLIQTGVIAAGVLLILISISVRLNRVPAVSWLFAGSLIYPLVFFLFFLLGVANSMLDVPANSILQEQASGAMRGRVYGMLAAAVGGVGVLPVIVGGILADVVGIGKVIFLVGILVFAYGVWRARYTRQ